jgi:hypothetical protein
MIYIYIHIYIYTHTHTHVAQFLLMSYPKLLSCFALIPKLFFTPPLPNACKLGLFLQERVYDIQIYSIKHMKILFPLFALFSLFWKIDKIIISADPSRASNSRICSSHFIKIFVYTSNVFPMRLHF